MADRYRKLGASLKLRDTLPMKADNSGEVWVRTKREGKKSRERAPRLNRGGKEYCDEQAGQRERFRALVRRMGGRTLIPLTCEIKRWKDRSEEECVPEGEETQMRKGREKGIDGQGTCVRWTWVRPGGTSCSPSRLPINQTRPNA
ncbi:hypothetical protein DBV15_08732 [Temnothorax longispinosus]|uniref:Uncharacterized protein n=1 Tax=Temnothorax longispinosus TaxID=300112 RepID=A0A4S2KPV1_9HYME|nr:hypothetical protein DBV15_08732 [Temnothorax longispinosus]